MEKVKLKLHQAEEDLKKQSESTTKATANELNDLKVSHGKLEADKKRLEAEVKNHQAVIDKTKTELTDTKKKLGQEEEEKKKLKSDLDETKKEFEKSFKASSAMSGMENEMKKKNERIAALERENQTHKQKL